MSKIIQSNGIRADLLTATSEVMYLPRVEALKRGVKKGAILAKNAAPETYLAYSNCGHECEKIFKEEDSIEILSISKYIIMTEENISQEFRLKNINETKNYLIEEINQNELMSKKYIKAYRNLNYTEQLLILISTVTRCVSISAFACLVSIPIGITSSLTGLKVCVITAGIN